MKIQLSDHFTYKRLIRFVFPSIIMMICTSMYSIIDGLFISNFAGKTAFAAVNLILPVAMGVGAIGFMIGSGGSAIVAKTLGEGKKEKANEYFSMLIFTALIGATILSIFGFIFIRQICMALGARGQLLEYASTYGRIMFVSQPMFMMQTIFYNFFITAEKPSYSLRMSLISGVINIVFDYLFIGVMHYGVAGAAVATAMGEYVGGLVPLIYFARKNNSSRLRLVKPVWRKDILLKTCLNGSSEFMTNASSSVVNMLYNTQLMRLAGADGVAAYGAVMYVNFIFVATFLGYAIGCAPVISYHYGAGNHAELKNLYKKSMSIILVWGVILFGAAQLLAPVLSKIFVGYNTGLYAMTLHGFRVYAIAFLIIGINIFGSSFFTALNNGLISAVISFLRTLVFQVIMVLTLPLWFGINGIWSAISIAEALTLIMTTTFFVRQKDKYHYL